MPPGASQTPASTLWRWPKHGVPCLKFCTAAGLSAATNAAEFCTGGSLCCNIKPIQARDPG